MKRLFELPAEIFLVDEKHLRTGGLAEGLVIIQFNVVGNLVNHVCLRSVYRLKFLIEKRDIRLHPLQKAGERQMHGFIHGIAEAHNLIAGSVNKAFMALFQQIRP